MYKKKLPDITKNTDVQKLIKAALKEDLGKYGDITTNGLFPDRFILPEVCAAIITREECILSGVKIAAMCFTEVDPSLKIKILAKDGERLMPNHQVMLIHGNIHGILAAERVALNFMQRMCGIATLTHSFVKIAAPYNIKILDTRKTTPLLRVLEKYAVLCGGGSNHRMGLFDMFLIKDNHRFFWRKYTGAPLRDAICKLRHYRKDLKIEIEVETLKEIDDVLIANPDWVLLDNFPINLLKKCVRKINKKVKVEYSGGVTLTKLKKIVRSGIDAVSIGSLTHSARAIDISLELL